MSDRIDDVIQSVRELTLLVHEQRSEITTLKEDLALERDLRVSIHDELKVIKDENRKHMQIIKMQQERIETQSETIELQYKTNQEQSKEIAKLTEENVKYARQIEKYGRILRERQADLVNLKAYMEGEVEKVRELVLNDLNELEEKRFEVAHLKRKLETLQKEYDDWKTTTEKKKLRNKFRGFCVRVKGLWKSPQKFKSTNY